MHARLPIRPRLIAVLFAASALLMRADDANASKSQDNSNYKTVPVDVGGKKIPVRVWDANPYAHMKSTGPTTDENGKYHPENYSFSAQSSLANKSFSAPTSDLSKNDPEFTNPDHNTYATAAYNDRSLAATVPGLDSKARFSSTSAYNRSVTGLDKSFATTATVDGDLTRSAGPATAADLQNRRADLGAKDETDLLAENSLAHKQYLGPGAQNVPDDVEIKDNIVLSRMSGIPNRDMSVDEVRDLINHGTKPDLDEKPDAPSKALNDPDYKPRPLRDNPSPGPASDDDKNDPVPAPGTMGTPPAPENSEPLPQP